MDSPGRPTVVVIAKTPEPGRVKTRLCPPCDAEQAASIAQAAIDDTFAAIDRALPTRRVLALDGAPGSWIPADYEVVEQVTGGLGERLDAAMRWAAGTVEQPSPVIVLGMDTPQVSGAELDAVSAALTRPGVDAVLGPAIDGGYWTVGFSGEVLTNTPGLFEGVPMSIDRTAEHQLARLDSLGLRCRLVDTLRDLDTWEDALEITRRFPTLATSAAVREVIGAASPNGASRVDR